ncbi:MAG: CNNM domain-containing protein [Thermogutta sp.]
MAAISFLAEESWEIVTLILSAFPFLLAMGCLGAASACFSAAEAAFFSLRKQDEAALLRSGPAGRVVIDLLKDVEQLLTAILFCNLVVNVVYFAVSSIVTLAWQRQGAITEAGLFATISLLALILFSEISPKSVAILRPRESALLLAFPIWLAVRVTRPWLPFFRGAAIMIRRTVWPHFQPEPYLRVRDLERAFEFSRQSGIVLEQEYQILQNLVQLSELKAEEVMRPRTEVASFRRPLQLAHLGQDFPTCGYFLIVEEEDEAFTRALSPEQLVRLFENQFRDKRELTERDGPQLSPPNRTLEDLAVFADPVIYVPWNVSAAEVLDALSRENRAVAAVVNEYGETVGVITLDDLLRRIFAPESSRSEDLYKRRSIQRVAPDVWHITGLTSVRRLARFFGIDPPPGASVTVSGIFQEQLGRMPTQGVECIWGPFVLKVLQMGRHGVMLVEIRRSPQGGGEVDQ